MRFLIWWGFSIIIITILGLFGAWDMFLSRFGSGFGGGGVRGVVACLREGAAGGFTATATAVGIGRGGIRASCSPLGRLLSFHSSTTSTTPSSSSSKSFSTSTTNAKMSTAADLISLLKNRRTYYALSASSPIPDAQIESIVKDVLLQSPSSFNSQSTRVLILFKEEHVKLWEFAKEAIKAIVPAEAYPASEQRLNGFQKGYGTVSFFFLSFFWIKSALD